MNGALTLGVVGHVDHGKTALVRSLTGTETDRLKEERERGLSIVLGFAFLKTAHGAVDLIDVPGHEHFIRAMIGGATALDGIVLCVAANEGIKPQTIEHFNIARLLGVDRGIVIVTKADLADPETLGIVRKELGEFLHGTFLEAAPVIEASATTGFGIDQLREALEALATIPAGRDRAGKFFLPLDRVFTMRGFGVIGTGTLRGGDLAVGDTVEILPARRQATVRALQNHNESVEKVSPGQRVAVNLRHVDREDLKRGSVLAAPGAVVPTARIDIDFRLLDDAPQPVRNGAWVRLLTGTTEVTARVRLLDRRELVAGRSAMVQLSLDREIATRASERCLIRTVSPMHTIGGGRIIEVNPERHRRFDRAVQRRLETAASGDPGLIALQRLEEAGLEPLDLKSLANEQSVAVESLRDVVSRLDAVDLGNDRFLPAEAYRGLETEILRRLDDFHAAHPLKRGIGLGTLIGELRSEATEDVVRHVVGRLVTDGHVVHARDALSLPGFDPLSDLNDTQQKLVRRIESAFLDSGLEPPSPESIVGSDKASRDLLRLLMETGRLVRLTTRDRKSLLVLHADAVEDARKAIERKYPYPEAFALKDIRDLLNSTRKYIVPLMEHFDAAGITIRRGDLRRLKT